MKRDGTGLTRKQRYALRYFASCSTVHEAARQSGVVPQTYYKWLQNPTFCFELEKEKATLRDEAMHILKVHLHKATEKLINLLNAESESIQRQTANDIINHLQRDRELCDIEERMEILEDRVKRCASKN